jgi:hypothetical protein
MWHNNMTGISGFFLTSVNGVPTWTKDKPVSIPTIEELEKYPALKNAWEQYLMTRKLLGL